LVAELIKGCLDMLFQFSDARLTSLFRFLSCAFRWIFELPHIIHESDVFVSSSFGFLQICNRLMPKFSERADPLCVDGLGLSRSLLHDGRRLSGRLPGEAGIEVLSSLALVSVPMPESIVNGLLSFLLWYERSCNFGFLDGLSERREPRESLRFVALSEYFAAHPLQVFPPPFDRTLLTNCQLHLRSPRRVPDPALLREAAMRVLVAQRHGAVEQ
jgi:hypothetical protein